MDNTLLTGVSDYPAVAIGKYEFTQMATGTYVVEISHSGFLVRYGVVEIKVTESEVYIRHRKLLEGDVNGDFSIIEKGNVAMRAKVRYYETSVYNAKYDLNGDGKVYSDDIYFIHINLGATSTIY